MTSVTLENLGKKFNDVAVVRGVNLAIEDGEFVVLVGPSGCGKTTTLRMIAGLETASEGTIRFGDTIVNHLAPRERNIAMVFQSYALYPHMTVARNLAFPLKNSRIPKVEMHETVRRTAELLNIVSLLDRKPKALSGGQQQRVAMGRAIVRRPEVFLFDEPLSNLDAALRTQMRIEIKKLHHLLKTTIIYVTHDQIEAMTLADRIVVMDKGEVVQVGTPADVYQRPRTKFVAGFIGSPRINFVPCRVVGQANDSLSLSFGANQTWSIPRAHRARFLPFKDMPLEIAVRPEHVAEEAHDPNAADFEAVASVVELTGPDTIIVFSLNGIDVSARCRPTTAVRPGERIRLSASFDHIYTVHPESGLIGEPS